MTDEEKEKCHAIIDRACVAEASTVIADSTILSLFSSVDNDIISIQINMIISLGAVFGKTLSKSAAREILDTTKKTLEQKESISSGVLSAIPIIGAVTTAIDTVTGALAMKRLGWIIAENFANTITEEEAHFYFSVAVIMMLIDGKSDQSELKLIKEKLQERTSSFGEKELQALIANPPDFRTLTKMYDAIKDKHDERYLDFADAVARADGILEDSEKVFMYKLQLLFSGIAEKNIYKITADSSEVSYSSKEYPVITYLTPETVQQRYPKTCISHNEFYVQHPADKESLMAIKEIFSPDFVHDKDTEILEAMRVAGASTVYIKATENTITEHQFKTELNAQANIRRTIDIEGSGKLDVSDSYDTNKNEIKVVKFSGGATLLPQEKEAFVKTSRWVIHDSHLNWLLNARFRSNPIKEFYWEVEYKDVANELLSANIAVKCGLIKVSAEASAAVDTAIKKMKAVKKVFFAEF